MPVTTDASTDASIDVDGHPIGTFRSGAALPGGVLAWDRLGVGHRCETWLAWSAALWSPVVVKFPRPHQTGHPRARASLRREVAALAGNLHPALPRLYDDGTGAPVPYLVFEHVDGVPLSDEIDEHGRFDVIDVARLGVQLLAALRTVHARGLAHVDIKPDNVMLRDARPVLLDFGSARPLGARQPQGALIGSPGYAAPELETGAPIGPAMDVYGVGVTLYEALLGAPVFEADLPAERRPDPVPLPPSEVAALVASMLAREPHARPDVDALLRRFGELAAYVPEWA